MHEAKAGPIIATKVQVTIDDDESLHWSDGSRGTKFRQGSGYSQSRRAFLTSYHFSVEEKGGIKEKLRRSVKELNEAAMGALVEIGREVGKRRPGIRVFRVSFSLPFLVPVKCFRPWFSKME
ncbi:hypothetical protein AAG906_012481 [Vitis piasezkii]